MKKKELKEKIKKAKDKRKGAFVCIEYYEKLVKKLPKEMTIETLKKEIEGIIKAKEK